MAKPGSGTRGRGRGLKVGGTEVRLIKAHKKKPADAEKTIRQGAVVVPTDNYDPEKFPAVERLRRAGAPYRDPECRRRGSAAVARRRDRRGPCRSHRERSRRRAPRCPCHPGRRSPCKDERIYAAGTGGKGARGRRSPARGARGRQQPRRPNPGVRSVPGFSRPAGGERHWSEKRLALSRRNPASPLLPFPGAPPLRRTARESIHRVPPPGARC